MWIPTLAEYLLIACIPGCLILILWLIHRSGRGS